MAGKGGGGGRWREKGAGAVTGKGGAVAGKGGAVAGKGGAVAVRELAKLS